MTLPKGSDSRPYATAGGFYIGDRVEMSPPKRYRRKTEPLRGRITTLWGSPKHGQQPGVMTDEGVHWNALDSWLTRIG